MIRLCDVILALAGLLLLWPVLLIVGILIWVSGDAPLFFQERVGKNRKPFILVKFRTMNSATKSVATHLAKTSDVTRIGRVLRRTKLDELPQLWNVLIGNMSIVGPRPCLFSQEDLISARERMGVFAVKPGITGLAQVKGVDMSTPRELALLDSKMLNNFGLRRYFVYILLTLSGQGAGDRLR
jgi:O-antigen biosynthesis protein WbqP